MSRTQWPAVRITRGAITLPVQAKPSLGPVSAWMKASEGKASIVASSPRMIEAEARSPASAAGASSAVARRRDRSTRAAADRRGRERFIASRVLARRILVPCGSFSEPSG
jgi:hypothetical protein